MSVISMLLIVCPYDCVSQTLALVKLMDPNLLLLSFTMGEQGKVLED